ncbi:spindle pole body component 97 [Curvularia clavata]|uniref:Spindle pole body component 97 n=1 Tax=Curvularia clavata TaxID=95742 RepID=A0A9Q8ZEH8_CURCL|nr:spindle pole body component 97 [Curvularia clavata]
MFSEYASKFLSQSQSRLSLGQPDGTLNRNAPDRQRPSSRAAQAYLQRRNMPNPYNSQAMSRFAFASRTSNAPAPLFYSATDDFREEDDHVEHDREMADHYALQRSRRQFGASNLSESSEVEDDHVQQSDHTIEADRGDNDAPGYGLGRGIKSSWIGDNPARGRPTTAKRSYDEERESSVPLSETTDRSSRGRVNLVDVELESTDRESMEELDRDELLGHQDEPPPSFQQFRNMPRPKRGRSPLRNTLPIPQETDEDTLLEHPRPISPDRQTVPDDVPENPTLAPRHNFFWAELFIIVQCAILGTWFISFLQESPPNKKNPLGDTIYTVLRSSFHLIGVYSLVSVIVGVLWLSLLRSFARPLVSLMLLAVPVISVSFFFYPFVSSFKGYWHGESVQDRLMRWLSFGPLCFAGFWVYTILKARHSLDKATGMLEFSSEILRAQFPLLLVGIATLGAVILWSWLWILMFTHLFLGGHFTGNKSRWIIDASTWWLGIAFFLDYFWTLAVIAGVQRATTAATVSQWYFHRNSVPTPSPRTVVQASLSHATYTMAGTICLSTLISLLVRLPLIVLPRRFAGMIGMCAYAVVPTPIAALTNPLTLTFASIHGVPLNQAALGLSQMNFISAASPTTTLGPSSFKDHGRPSIQSYRLAKLLLHAIRWVITLALGFGGWVSTARMLQLGNGTVPYKGSLYAYVVGLISAAIGWGALGAMEVKWEETVKERLGIVLMRDVCLETKSRVGEEPDMKSDPLWSAFPAAMSSRNVPTMKSLSAAERRSVNASHSSTARPRVAMGEEQDRRSTTTPLHAKRHSATMRATGPATGERRTEKREVRERETEIRRIKSPLKPSSESRPSARSRVEKQARDVERPSRSSASQKSTHEEPQAPWEPQASLVPHTTAPLATRISVPPLAATAPVSLQPTPLAQLSLEAQEKAILEDLLFVFMGFEGQYIRFSDVYNPHEEKERLVGPQFRLMPGLDPSLRDLTKSMLKTATHYIAVEACVEVLSREEYGAVNHALCAAVRRLLKDYLTLIAQLEHQLLTNDSFTLHVLNLHTKQTSHMLFQLYTTGIELLKANGILEDEKDEDSADDDSNDFENILESLREGGNATKKICKGGSVLGLITKRLASMSGDPAARTLLTTLLREASRPYMAMLNEWLHHGGIKDPHSEFLIKEQRSIKRERLDQDYTDEYWEKRYTIRDNLVPPQLEAVKDKVLLAGKYLNVVRECGGVDVSKIVQDAPTSFDDPRFLDNVNSSYAYANSSLLNLLLTTHQLPARLRSLKHYFFLDRSDFFTYFLEMSELELKKPAKHVNVGKLQSLLDLATRHAGSVAVEDPYKEDIKVQINNTGLTNWLMKIVNVQGLDQEAATATLSSYTPANSAPITDDTNITGYQALVFDYAMPFPLSLVVSRVTLTRYQLLFRYLLSLKHLETDLAKCWGEQGKNAAWKHRSRNPRIEQWKRRAWTLRARMLVFVQQLTYYCTSEVIEPNWASLMSRISEEKNQDARAKGKTTEDDSGGPQVKRTVDELMQDHVDFLATCLKECMLTNSKLLRINNKIMQTCSMFASFTYSLSRYLITGDPDLVAQINATLAPPQPSKSSKAPAAPLLAATHRPTSQFVYDPQRVDKMFDMLAKYEENFTRHLKILLDTLNYLAATETVVFLSLCARLTSAGEGLSGFQVPMGMEGIA